MATDREQHASRSPIDRILSSESDGDPMVDEPGARQPDPVIGTPEDDAALFPGAQGYKDTCAIRCQEFILEMYTGQDFPEDQLVQEAAEHGWYAPGGGTSPDDVGNLLELHGIEVNRFENANVYTLVKELGQGHKVVIGVDSGELWQENPILESIHDFFGFEGADHAVVVSGIDTSDPNDLKVIVSDPGTGEAAATYPLDEFLDAWADSDFFMMTTAEPAPPDQPEMVNFPYDTGHVAEVYELPWEDFLAYEDQQADFEQYIQDQPVPEGFEPLDTFLDNVDRFLDDPHANLSPVGGSTETDLEAEPLEEDDLDLDEDADAEDDLDPDDDADAEFDVDQPNADW